MDIPPVQVQMLGRFVIRRGSQEVSVSGRSQKLCLLLAALIWERDRPLSYHELTQLLWAETGHGPNPVNALKAILHRGRRAPVVPPGPPHPGRGAVFPPDP